MDVSFLLSFLLFFCLHPRTINRLEIVMMDDGHIFFTLWMILFLSPRTDTHTHTRTFIDIWGKINYQTIGLRFSNDNWCTGKKKGWNFFQGSSNLIDSYFRFLSLTLSLSPQRWIHPSDSNQSYEATKESIWWKEKFELLFSFIIEEWAIIFIRFSSSACLFQDDPEHKEEEMMENNKKKLKQSKLSNYFVMIESFEW